MKAVVLLSGGLDSSTVLALVASTEDVTEVHCVAFFYGQKHTRMEAHASANIVNWARRTFRDKHVDGTQFVLNQDLFAGSGSTLVAKDNMDLPATDYETVSNEQGASSTVVPFRNANLISAATSFALTKGCDNVYIGANAEDARHGAYPDCTPEFMDAMKMAVWIGSDHKVRLWVPLQAMFKPQIVQTAQEYGVPFELTWTCYAGKAEPCGTCPSCVERAHGFSVAGIVDPLVSGMPARD